MAEQFRPSDGETQQGPPPSYTTLDQPSEPRQNSNRPHVSFAEAPIGPTGRSSENLAALNSLSTPKTLNPFKSNPFRRTHTDRQDLPRSSRDKHGRSPRTTPPASPGATPSRSALKPSPGSSTESLPSLANTPLPNRYHGLGSATRAPENDPPAYEPWMEVPDNSSLPPPPSIHHTTSPTANATQEAAERAREWCRRHPLLSPRQLIGTELPQKRATITLSVSPSLTGTVAFAQSGMCVVRTVRDCEDSILLSSVPLYAALYDDPSKTGKTKTIYFEILVKHMRIARSSHEKGATIALGFVAPPYPAWRLPGWERASLGVHGDDGRRYVDDNWGGKDFTTPFRVGEVVGIGMNFHPPEAEGSKGAVEVFFTRNGGKEGSWNLFEERDSTEEGSVAGLDGTRDLMGAVGFFGLVEFEVRFYHGDWKYWP